jgi:hypothetical protein
MRSLKFLVIGLLVATFVIFGCRVGTPAAPEAEGPAEEEPVEQPAEEEPVEAGRGPVTFAYAGVGLETLDSYTARFTLDFEGTSDTSDAARLSFQVDLAGQREPPLTSIRNQFEGEGVMTFGADSTTEVTSGSLSMLATADMVYIETEVTDQPYNCFAYPGNETPFDAGFQYTSPDDFIGEQDMSLAEVGPEEVNGIPSTHYRAENVSGGDFTNATVDIWVADDGDYVTRIEMSDEGSYEFGTGTISITYEVLTVNEPLDISPPADCMELPAP